MNNPNPRDKNLDIKIESIRLTIEQMEQASHGEPEIEALIDTLHSYEHMLVREKLQIAMSFDDLSDLKQGVRHCGAMLADLAEEAPQEMAGWYHGAQPVNGLYAWANLLSRLILEFSGTIFAFEQFFPDLKEHFDAERARHAKRITEEMEAEVG